MPLLFSEADLDLMRRVRDVFNPTGLLNPGKILPTSQRLRRNLRAPAPGIGRALRMSGGSAMVLSRLAELVGPSHVDERSGGNRHVSNRRQVASGGGASWLQRRSRRDREIRGGRKARDCSHGRADETRDRNAAPKIRSRARYDADRSRRRLRSGRSHSQRRAGNPSAQDRRHARGTQAISAARRSVHGSRDGGRHDRVRRGFPAAANLRHGARLRAGNGVRHRRRSRGEERRARGEECRGIRHAQTDDRRAGNARRDHQDQFPHVSASASGSDMSWRRFAGQLRRASSGMRIARSRLRPQSVEILAAGAGCDPLLGRRAAVSFDDDAGPSWSHSRATRRFSTAPGANCRGSRGA